MEVKIKKLNENAVIPRYAHPTDAGLDLVAVSKSKDKDGNFVYGTGLAFEIPDGFVGLVFPRSSVSARRMTMANCVGVIDSGYRGEIRIIALNTDKEHAIAIKRGDRIAQLVIQEVPAV